MRRVSIIMAIVMALTLMTASVALAAPNESAWCAGTAGATTNHGVHITDDYVHPNGGGPADSAGGGAPAHFWDGPSPGASFCQGDNSAPNLGPDHWPLPE